MTIKDPQDSAKNEALVKYWLEKARESLESARNEYGGGRLSFAMNRIYYACFYTLTALFRDRGQVFKRHKGLRSALHRELVRNGIVEKHWGKFFDDEFASIYFLTSLHTDTFTNQNVNPIFILKSGARGGRRG